MRKLSLLGCVLVLLVSCNGGPRLRNTVEDEIAAIDYLFRAGLTVSLDFSSDYWSYSDREERPIYEGKDIVKYFGRIPPEIICVHPYDDEERRMANENFYASLRMLEDYVKGKTTEYPYEAIHRQISEQTGEYARTDSEAYGENLLVDIDLLLTRFADVAFKYCPDLTKIATQVSDDGNAGVMEPPIVSYYPVFTFIFFKSSDGVNFRVEHREGSKPTRVAQFQHIDDEGEAYQYYLFDCDPRVYDKIGVDWSSCLELYKNSGGNIRKTDLFDEENRNLASNWLSLNPSATPYYVVFFPEEYKWKFCKKNKKGDSPVPGMPSLCIHFNPLSLEIVP